MTALEAQQLLGAGLAVLLAAAMFGWFSWVVYRSFDALARSVERMAAFATLRRSDARWWEVQAVCPYRWGRDCCFDARCACVYEGCPAVEYREIYDLVMGARGA